MGPLEILSQKEKSSFILLRHKLTKSFSHFLRRNLNDTPRITFVIADITLKPVDSHIHYEPGVNRKQLST